MKGGALPGGEGFFDSHALFHPVEIPVERVIRVFMG